MKILLLEDLEEDAGLIERSLKKENFQFTSKRIDTEEEFRKGLMEFKPDIVLSDHSLPSFNSIEALKVCNQYNFNGPFILVTGSVSEEFAVMCLKQGADDYVLKSNLSRLPVAINTALAFRKNKIKQQRQQEAIRKQNEELVKINKELDSFVYSISHNLRAPLTSVLGLVNLARLESLTDHQTSLRYFNLIERSIFKLDETLKEILDYSRNSRGVITVGKISAEQLIQDTLEKLKYMEAYQAVQLKTVIEENSLWLGDKYRAEVILMNLLSNAIKYYDCAKDVPTVTVTLKIDINTVTLAVTDNGIGIANEYLPQIYNMFFRATEKSEGSGLGLYITKEIVARLDGTITITSTVGEGTHVLVSIPNAANLGWT